jgi:hypothetical protein
VQIYANTGGKRPIQRQPLLMQYKQQTNPLLPMYNYTPLVISRNDKNKQLTLLSQRKISLTTKNIIFALLNHWSTEKISKIAPSSISA